MTAVGSVLSTFPKPPPPLTEKDVHRLTELANQAIRQVSLHLVQLYGPRAPNRFKDSLASAVDPFADVRHIRLDGVGNPFSAFGRMEGSAFESQQRRTTLYSTGNPLAHFPRLEGTPFERAQQAMKNSIV